jgi:hypothetical protein
MTLFGAVVTPHAPIEVSAEMRALLPKDAIVRMVEQTKLAGTGETIAAYDVGSELKPDPHLIVLKDKKVADTFRLATIFGKNDPGPGWVLFKASEFQLPQGKNMFVAAYRNIGDGAATVFVLVAEQGGDYKIFWDKLVSQGRFEVLRDGKMQVWGAAKDGACIWCPHVYKVTALEWKDGRVANAGRFETKRRLDPLLLADEAITIEK